MARRPMSYTKVILDYVSVSVAAVNSSNHNQNVLIGILPLQLADFGLSNHFQRGALLQTYCGSPLYAAPEIVKGLPYQGPEVAHNTDFGSDYITASCFHFI